MYILLNHPIANKNLKLAYNYHLFSHIVMNIIDMYYRSYYIYDNQDQANLIQSTHNLLQLIYIHHNMRDNHHFIDPKSYKNHSLAHIFHLH